MGPLDLDRGSVTASFPIMWPFGSRPMRFTNQLTLVPNPVVWFAALLGLIVGFGGLVAGRGLGKPIFSARSEKLLAVFLLLYLGFMVAVSSIRRILYLNHYMLGLIFSFFILALVLKEIFGTRRITNRIYSFAIPAVFLGAIAGGYCFFRPLTYGQPLSCEEFRSRAFLRFWNMKNPACEDPAAKEDHIETIYRVRLKKQSSPEAM